MVVLLPFCTPSLLFQVTVNHNANGPVAVGCALDLRAPAGAWTKRVGARSYFVEWRISALERSVGTGRILIAKENATSRSLLDWNTLYASLAPVQARLS
jgi:hypothetical protein